jgi:hypothetical protein
MIYLLERILFRNTMLPNCNKKKISIILPRPIRMIYLLERMLFRNTQCYPTVMRKDFNYITQTNQNDLFVKEDVLQKYNVNQL